LKLEKKTKKKHVTGYMNQVTGYITGSDEKGLKTSHVTGYINQVTGYITGRNWKTGSCNRLHESGNRLHHWQ